MNYKVKDIDMKICLCYFFNDITNIKTFDLNNIKVDEMSYRNITIYYIGYVTINYSKYVKAYSVNPLYLILTKVN